MPTPSPDEDESTFMSRCIPIVMNEGTADNPSQAAAICHSMWDRNKMPEINTKLVELIKSRTSGEQFGYGITTADRYVTKAISELDGMGAGLAAKHLKLMGNARENIIKRASNTLAFCGSDTKTDKTETNVHAMAKLLGVAPPPHAMMAIVNRLTTPREDRDGDTLQTKGANLDPKAPLLWQHLHNIPLGKMVRVIEKTDHLLKVATVLLDLDEFTENAAKLVEADALRFSHGFIPLKFEERKGGPMARFNILEYDIVEESLVSVPSNVDAEIELFARGKLTHPVFKAHGKALFDARTKSMPVTDDTKAIIEDVAVKQEDKQEIQQSLNVPEVQQVSVSQEEKIMAIEQKVTALELQVQSLNGQPESEKAPGDGGITAGQIGPVPNQGEAQEAFQMRCMLDPTMMDNYPTEADRQAACGTQWSQGKSSAMSVSIKKWIDEHGDLSIPLEVLETVCPSCANIAKNKGWKAVKLSVLAKEPNNMSALCESIDGEHPHGNCVDMVNGWGDSAPSDPDAFCNWLSHACGLKASGKTIEGARAQLESAIARHRRHMDGTEATSDDSQELLMKELESALAELSGMKRGTLTTKAGRVLSQRNYDTLKDAMGDMDEMMGMDIPRAAKALCKDCKGKVQSVVDSAAPEEDEPDMQPKTVESMFRDAVALVGENRECREQMRKLLQMFDEADEQERIGDEFRVLTSSG